MTYPKLVTIAIISKENKILLIKRNNEPEIGKWALPGGCGAFKKFSDPKEAVKDEVYYDLRVRFIPRGLLGNYFQEDDPPILSIVYLGKIEGEPSINKLSAVEWVWFTEAKISNLDLAFDHKRIIRDYFISKK
ncbi:MAG: NUDIX domain-containing protein [archaeon]